MTPERARELIGGLSTGILTPEERQTLFEAALHDQALFNEVADELEFGAFLQSAETRAQLANRIEVEPERRSWWALRSRWLAASGVLAASLVVFVAVWQQRRPEVVNDATAVTVQAPKAAVTPVTPPVAATVPPQGQPLPAPEPKGPAAAAKPKASEDRQVVAEKDKAPVELAMRRDEAKREEGKADPPTVAPAAAPAPAQAVNGVAPGAPPPPIAPESPRPASRAFAPMDARASAAPTRSAAPAATLQGIVHDVSGAAVANASIQIVNTANNTTTRTTSDLNGQFGAGSLQPGGPYTVIAQAPGFKTEQKSGVTLATNRPAQVDIPLQVGALAETVEVTGATSSVLPSVQMDRLKAQQSGKGLLPPATGQQIAVLNFANDSPQNPSGQQVADQLSNQLLDSGQNVINRDKVQQAQQALSKQAGSGRQPTAKEAAAVGRKVGADTVIVGSVKGSGDVALTAQVIETKKAKQLANVGANGASLQGATNQLGLKLESQLAPPLDGTITKVDSDTVSATLNPPGEVRIGVRLDVLRDKRKIGELTVTSARGQTAIGKFTGPGNPRAGDRVTSSLTPAR